MVIFDLMKEVKSNTQLVEGYLALLQNMSLNNKLDLISKLTLSVKMDLSKSNEGLKASFGAWDETESAENLIFKISGARTFTRNTESF